jgi:hypothetical protein
MDAVAVEFDFMEPGVAFRRRVDELGELRRDPSRSAAASVRRRRATVCAIAAAGSFYPAGACVSSRWSISPASPRRVVPGCR